MIYVATACNANSTAIKSKLTQFIKSIHRCKCNRSYISRHGWTRISLSAEAINHTMLCLSVKNTPETGYVSLSFVYKIIFQSSSLCSGGGYTLNISTYILASNDLNMTPRLRHHLRNYAHLYTPRPMYNVYCGRCTCSPGIACAM